MLTVIKEYIKAALVPLFYAGGYVVMLLSIFKEARWGLLLLIFMIPQPNVWYKFHSFSMGKDFLDFLFIAVTLGIFIQKKGFSKNFNSLFIIVFILYSYLTLWNTSLSFSLPAPISSDNILLFDFKNYAQMICLYFFALIIFKDEEQQKAAVVVMTAVLLIIAVRSYRNFTAGPLFDYDKRVDGPFWAVGLGSNHCGAFFAHYLSVCLGLFLFDKNKRRKLLYLFTIIFGLYPLLYAYSRGAYLAALAVMTFLGLIKKRILLVIAVFIVTAWNTVLPESVIDRINMTETPSGNLEGSAAQRLDLWNLAFELYEKNPAIGIGFGGFALSIPEDFNLGLTDTHSFYLKTLCEQGILGISFLIFMFFFALVSGWRLCKTGTSDFYKGLGFGFIGCVIACIITNVFGDRFSYFSLGGYFWIFWGLVDRGIAESNKSIASNAFQSKALTA